MGSISVETKIFSFSPHWGQQKIAYSQNQWFDQLKIYKVDKNINQNKNKEKNIVRRLKKRDFFPSILYNHCLKELRHDILSYFFHGLNYG